jgi:cell division protein ZapA (FtsZ GTPase activity inhibitor)
MEEISVTIHIAGRQYRLKSDENGRKVLEKAAEEINKALRLFSEHFAYKDNQDLLAMVSMQQTVSLLNLKAEMDDTSEKIEEEIFRLEALLEEDHNRHHVL